MHESVQILRTLYTNKCKHNGNKKIGFFEKKFESVKGEQLASYYDSIMPILQHLLRHAHETGLESLWGQTMECCAIVGEASIKFIKHKIAFLLTRGEGFELTDIPFNITSNNLSETTIGKSLPCITYN